MEGDWAPEEEVKIDVERPDPEPKEIHMYNTELYKAVDLAKNHKTDSEVDEDTDQPNVDCDDWSNYPASRTPHKYRLTGYCGISGRAKFRKLSPIMEEEEVFNIIGSEDITGNDVFEEDIQEEENQVFATTHESQVDDQQPSREDFDRLNSSSIASSRTIKDLNILSEYIQNEGNTPSVRAKCGDCIKQNCKSCFKVERMTPKEATVLEELRGNIEEEVLSDSTICFSVKYATYKPLENTFPSHLSNYNDAQIQARNNFRKLLKSEKGLEAVRQMMKRGESDGHFKILSKQETKTVLAGPHCFSYQTTAFKESSQSTKVRHVSNLSNIGTQSGSSLNMEQKVS